MIYDISQITHRQVYHLLIGLVAPRPIALITSMDAAGNLNAAPFSAYNYLGTDPPVVAIGVGNRTGPDAPIIIGKDTAQNIRNTGEFVVNVVNEDIAQQMNICAVDFPPGVNELEMAGLTTTPSTLVKVPRIAEAPAALECKEFQTIEIGRSRIILGQVIAVYVNDDYIDQENTYVLSKELHAIGRMNGLGNYVRAQDAFFQMHRMKYEEWLEKQDVNISTDNSDS